MTLALAPAMRAIAASIGPDGRHVVYSSGDRIGMARTGVDIARRICSDHYACSILKETLIDVERQFGDGTARVAVMAGAALEKALKARAAGIAADDMFRALDQFRPALESIFRHEAADTAKGAEVMASSNLDAEMESLVVDAWNLAGPDGLIEVREGGRTGVFATDGHVFDAISVGSMPVTEMSDVHLIVANEVLDDFRSLASVIDGFAARKKALVIVARDIRGEALHLIERNLRAGLARFLAVRPADVSTRAVEVLHDLAAATGATLIARETGTDLDHFRPSMLGRASGMSFEHGRLRLPGARRDEEAVAMRIAAAEAEAAAKRHLPLDREHAERRRARLQGKWIEVTIARGVDAPARIEQTRRAIAGLRAANAGGIIRGGACGLERIADRVDGLERHRDPVHDVGVAMICAALRAPVRCMRRNSPQWDDRPPLSRPDVADPAGMSRDLLDIALSLASHLASIDGAVTRPGRLQR